MADGVAVAKYIPGVFLRRDPGGPAAPVVFDIPRSGGEYPRRFRSSAPFDAVQRSISMYLEELYADAPDAGATYLFALFPNAFVDANRHETDIDPAMIDGTWPGTLEPTIKSELGIGLIHSMCGIGDIPLQDGKLSVADVRDRIENYFLPYHDELAAQLEMHRQRSGVAFHVSCHSMASIGGKSTVDAGQPRSQFDIGDRHGTTCEPGFVAVVKETLENFGYEVTVNKHYAGAESIRRHARPEAGIHSLQIEMNRSLYMEEDEFLRGEAFDTVRGHLAALEKAICAYARDRTATGGKAPAEAGLS
ncbi:N-formylglutamate amidohydrolase [Acuticoccus sediminis]|uniref:N-formylglutamate amidohydrolase n=1 Tax=Acuticoccus sediminis TaxID=2184697 RepID=UPI00139153F8|nr:N-formylglutamate amidohydrolase [Acuticoccus sediminis]